MTFTTESGDVFESECDLVDVTSLHRPDTAWVFVDAHAHEHRWFAGDQAATAYSPIVNYHVPTIVKVHDGWGYWEDGERYEIFHYECRECGERIEPGYTADTTTQHIPGLRSYRINGESVSEEEYRRRGEAAIAAMKRDQ